MVWCSKWKLEHETFWYSWNGVERDLINAYLVIYLYWKYILVIYVYWNSYIPQVTCKKVKKSWENNIFPFSIAWFPSSGAVGIGHKTIRWVECSEAPRNTAKLTFSWCVLPVLGIEVIARCWNRQLSSQGRSLRNHFFSLLFVWCGMGGQKIKVYHTVTCIVIILTTWFM